MQTPFIHHYQGIPYPIRLLQRRSYKRLVLSVTRQGDIRISAPTRISHQAIQTFLRAQKPWLDARLAQIPPQQNAQRDYGDNSCHPYLGREIRLRLHHAARASYQFSAADDSLHLSVPTENAVLTTLKQFYRVEAQRLLPVRVQAQLAKTPWVAKMPEIRLRWMKAQWGNCAQKGHLTFNTQLIKAAPDLIDYVILHELCHLQEFNHSPRFYALMDAVAPNWRDSKAALDTHTHDYLR